jgi:hypothetical protein
MYLAIVAGLTWGGGISRKEEDCQKGHPCFVSFDEDQPRGNWFARVSSCHLLASLLLSFVLVNTSFSIPPACLYATLVEYFDQREAEVQYLVLFA